MKWRPTVSMEIPHVYQINGGHVTLCIKVNKIRLPQRRWVTFSIQTKNSICSHDRLSPSLPSTSAERPPVLHTAFISIDWTPWGVSLLDTQQKIHDRQITELIA